MTLTDIGQFLVVVTGVIAIIVALINARSNADNTTADGWKEILAEVKAQYNEIKTDYTQMEREKADLEQRTTDLEDRSKELEEENIKLTHRVKELEKHNSEKDNLIGKLTQQVGELKEKLEEVQKGRRTDKARLTRMRLVMGIAISHIELLAAKLEELDVVPPVTPEEIVIWVKENKDDL